MLVKSMITIISAQETLPTGIAGLKSEDGWAMLRVTYRQELWTLWTEINTLIFGQNPTPGRLKAAMRTQLGWS